MKTSKAFSAAFKTKVVMECLSGEKRISEITRAYKISPTLVSKWRNEFIENSVEIFERNLKRAEDKNRIAELERLVGRLTLENEMLKKASKLMDKEVSSKGK